MKKYFDEKMELVDKINNKLEEFLDKASDITLQESSKELHNCHQFAKQIKKNLNTTKMIQDSGSSAADYAAYYMCQNQLGMYKYAVLLSHSYNLHNEIDKQQKPKKRHTNKFTKIQ